MCKNVQSSAVIAGIFMKFGMNMLNWILNDPRNFYQKQTLDSEITEFFRRGPVFFTHPVYNNIKHYVQHIQLLHTELLHITSYYISNQIITLNKVEVNVLLLQEILLNSWCQAIQTVTVAVVADGSATHAYFSALTLVSTTCDASAKYEVEDSLKGHSIFGCNRVAILDCHSAYAPNPKVQLVAHLPSRVVLGGKPEMSAAQLPFRWEGGMVAPASYWRQTL